MEAAVNLAEASINTWDKFARVSGHEVREIIFKASCSNEAWGGDTEAVNINSLSRGQGGRGGQLLDSSQTVPRQLT